MSCPHPALTPGEGFPFPGVTSKLGRSYSGMDLDELMDMPGGREPLVTVGEAHAVVRLLEAIGDGDSEEAGAAGELRMRLAMRLPS